VAKKEGYSPIGKGGNGLVLHSAFAMKPMNGQSIGLLFQHTGVVVRTAHNCSLDSDSECLWSKLEAQPISFDIEIELPQASKRSASKVKLAIRFCPVNLRTPYRFHDRYPLLVYAVYATL